MSALVTPVQRTNWKRSALRWLPTFFGFPLGGLLAEVVGPVDAPLPAMLGGAITGLILGAVQSWGLELSGTARRHWILATGAGLAVGLGAGAATVDYATTMGRLATQGALCGLAVGAAQSVVLRPRLGSLAFVWAPVASALWALGWVVTTAIGVDVERRYTVFGSSGALTVTLLSTILPLALASRTQRSSR